MPYKSYGCSICHKQAPMKLREHGTFAQRFEWLRRHYKKKHPIKFKEWYS